MALAELVTTAPKAFVPRNVVFTIRQKRSKCSPSPLVFFEMYAVIGAGYEVYNTLGPGFLKVGYHETQLFNFEDERLELE